MEVAASPPTTIVSAITLSGAGGGVKTIAKHRR